MCALIEEYLTNGDNDIFWSRECDPHSNHKSPYMNTSPTILHIDALKASLAMLPREDGQQYQCSLFPFVLAALLVVYMYIILFHLAKAATESDTACSHPLHLRAHRLKPPITPVTNPSRAIGATRAHHGLRRHG
jgi:hypothetical protein